MGAIMNTDTRTRTIKEWADMYGIKPDTARTRATRTFGRAIGQTSVLTADEWKRVYPDNAGQKPDKTKKQSVAIPVPAVQKVVPSEPKPEPEPTKSVSFEWEFWAINFLEMALIVFGLVLLYQLAGLILGLMCCLFLLKAQKLARKPQHREAVKSAVNVVLYMCIASGALHLVTFWNALKIRTSTFNAESEVVTDYWMLLLKIASAALPAVFVAYISYSAVKTTAKIHLKNN